MTDPAAALDMLDTAALVVVVTILGLLAWAVLALPLAILVGRHLAHRPPPHPPPPAPSGQPESAAASPDHPTA